MLKRKIINQLIVWKNTKNKKCLLIQGARQTGKTYAENESQLSQVAEKT